MTTYVVHRLRGVAAALAVVSLGACDFPTELPIFEPRLVVEAERTTLTVGQLLPSSVSIQGANFALSVGASTPVPRRLDQICPPCAVFSGQTVPKPPFEATITASTTIPADVRTAALVSGNIVVSINNQFSFDPIRPGPVPGSVRILIRNGTTVVADTTISGASHSIPARTPNTPFTIRARPGTLTGSSPITVDLTLNSPAGDPVPISGSDSFTITATPQNFLISTATVGVTNKTVNAAAVTLDLEDIDEDFVDRVKQGALVLEINNPFGVTGTLNVTFNTPGIAPKSVVLGSTNPSTQRIEFTGAELRQLLGKSVQMNISGPVSGPAGGVTVTPTQVLTVTSKLDLILTTKTDN